MIDHDHDRDHRHPDLERRITQKKWQSAGVILDTMTMNSGHGYVRHTADNKLDLYKLVALTFRLPKIPKVGSNMWIRVLKDSSVLSDLDTKTSIHTYNQLARELIFD